MKKVFALVMAALLALSALPALGEETETLCLPKEEVLVDGQVVFNDAAVQKAIEATWPYMLLGVDGLEKIESLTIDDQDPPAVDLSVLQLCTNLKAVQINSGKLKSLEPLAKCSKLRVVYLLNAPTLDLEPLTKLKNLETVLVQQGEEQDYSVLADCAKLEMLGLSETKVTDLSFLPGLKKLTSFQFTPQKEHVPSLEPITQCPKLTSLTLSFVEPHSLQELAGLTKLRSLKVGNFMPDGLEAVLGSNQKTLQSLTLSGDGSQDASFGAAIGQLTKLKELLIGKYRSLDLSGIESCKALETVELGSIKGETLLDPLGQLAKLNALRLISMERLRLTDLSNAKALKSVILQSIEDAGDLSALGQAPKLAELNLNHVRKPVFDGIEKLPALNSLTLNFVEGQRFDWIAKAPKLKTLRLQGIRPDSFGFLDELTCGKTLEELGLSAVDVTDISFLQGMSKLKVLYLLDTQVTSIQPLEDTPKLTGLYLFGNPIEDYSVITGLKKLEQLTLSSHLSPETINALQVKLPKVYIEQTTGREYGDGLYETALFFGDSDPVKREDRTPPESKADEKMLQEHQAERRQEAAVDLEKQLKDAKELTADDVGGYATAVGGRFGYCIDTFTSNAEVVQLPAQVDGQDVLELDLYIPYEANVRALILPATIRAIDRIYGNDTTLEAVIVDPDNPAYCSLDGAVFTKDMKTLVYCPPNINGGSGQYAIPDGVENVHNGALKSSSVSIPASVKDLSMQNEQGYNGNSIGSLTVDENNPYYTVTNGMLTSKDGSVLYYIPSAAYHNGAESAIPEGIQTIAVGALANGFDSKLLLPNSLIGPEEGATWRDVCGSSIPFLSVSEDHPVYVSRDGALLSKDEKTLYALYTDARTGGAEARIPEGVETVASGSLSSCPLLNVPASVRELSFEHGNDGPARTGINVDPGNAVYSSIDGVLFSADQKTLLYYPCEWAADKDGTYAVPEGTEIVAKEAFAHGGYGLNELILPDTLTEFHSTIASIYSSTGTCTVVVPDSVTVISDEFFEQEYKADQYIFFEGTLVTPEGSAADEMWNDLDEWRQERVILRRP